MMPVMAYDLLDAIELLAATRNFAERLVDGLEADRERVPGVSRAIAGHGHGPRAGHRLRKSSGAGERSLRYRPHHPRSGTGKERIIGGRAGAAPRSRESDPRQLVETSFYTITTWMLAGP